MTLAGDHIGPLELLHRTAEWVGATVCLTGTRDALDENGRRPFAGEPGSELKLLAVVVPHRAKLRPRARRLTRGRTLCSIDAQAAPLDELATILVDHLLCAFPDLGRRAA